MTFDSLCHIATQLRRKVGVRSSHSGEAMMGSSSDHVRTEYFGALYCHIPE